MAKNAFYASRKTKIIIISLFISVAIIFCFMIYNVIHSYDSARNDVLELSKSKSNSNTKAINTYFERHADVLLTSSEVLEYLLGRDNVTSADVELLLHEISVAYNNQLYESIFGKKFSGVYATIDGIVLHGMRPQSDLEDDYNPEIRQWYIEGKAGNGNVVFGDPYNDIYNPEIIDITATKLLSDGKNAIAMDLTVEDVQSMYDDLDTSIEVNGEDYSYGYGFIMTRNGIVISHTDKSEQLNDYSKVQSPMYDVYINASISDSNEYIDNMNIDGVDYCYLSHRLSNGWYYVDFINLDNAKTSASLMSSRLLVITSIILLFVLVYCSLITEAYISSDKMSGKLKKTLQLAMVDSLTNALNRAAFDLRAKEISNMMASKNDESFALIMFDLNDLKFINDNYGHNKGDEYIKNSCKFIKSIFPCDLYRIGGDEFSLFITGELFKDWEVLYDNVKLLSYKANMRLAPNVDEPSLAIGLVIHTSGGTDSLDDLMRKADAEMYANKLSVKQSRLEHSKNGNALNISQQLVEKQILVSDMQKGLEEEQFDVWFQPQVNHAENGTLVGAEALVRWIHPTRGLISPAIFIPLFEYNGLIYDLDKYVWKHTCKYVRMLLDSGYDVVPVSVNVSQLDIIQHDFLETISSIVDEYKLPHNLIHLEVTESSFSDDTGKVGDVVNELIDRGFIIAIDDFGSGYSSLSLLRNVNAHIVKMDMRFFTDEENAERNKCIIESVIKMVGMLGMKVLAEGVEYTEQADSLCNIGCQYIQGFLYSRPLNGDDYIKYLKSHLVGKKR